MASALLSSTVWVAEMLTTASATLSTRSARLVGRAWARAGALEATSAGRAERDRRDVSGERGARDARIWASSLGQIAWRPLS